MTELGDSVLHKHLVFRWTQIYVTVKINLRKEMTVVYLPDSVFKTLYVFLPDSVKFFQLTFFAILISLW